MPSLMRFEWSKYRRFWPFTIVIRTRRWELRLVVVVDVLTARKQYRIPHGGAVVLAAAQSGSGPGAATCPTGTPDRVRTQ